MKMKKIIFSLHLLIIAFAAAAAKPQWSVDYTAFSNTMTITGVVQYSGAESGRSGDMVAAFAGSQCRGVANVQPSATLGRAYAYLMIYSNASDETLTFKLYDSANDRVIDVPGSDTYEIDRSAGSQQNPYIFSDQTVDGSALTAFSVSAPSESVVIDPATKTVQVSVADSVSPSALKTLFELSPGARILVNGEELQSTDTVDFTRPVVFSVVSQTGTISEWTVTVGSATVADEMPSDVTELYVFNDFLEFSNVPTDTEAIITSIDGRIEARIYPLTQRVGIDTLHNGVYIVAVSTNGNTVTQKLFVKQ